MGSEYFDGRIRSTALIAGAQSLERVSKMVKDRSVEISHGLKPLVL
jgi:hypothetical protein